MNVLDNIKGAAKFAASQFLFGEEVNERQAARLHICKTSGKGGGVCHNFQLFSTQFGMRPRCCRHDLEGCQPYHNGCKCWLMEKTKLSGEHCPLNKW